MKVNVGDDEGDSVCCYLVLGIEIQVHFWWERIFCARAEPSCRVADSTVTNREISFVKSNRISFLY